MYDWIVKYSILALSIVFTNGEFKTYVKDIQKQVIFDNSAEAYTFYFNLKAKKDREDNTPEINNAQYRLGDIKVYKRKKTIPKVDEL